MSNNYYREYINTVLPRKFQRALVPWMEVAHQLVKTEMERDFYRYPTSRKHIGDLVNIAVDGCLATMIDQGLLEAKYEFATYPSSSQKYLKIITNGIMAVHCRISKPNSFIRSALHRNYQRLANFKIMKERQTHLALGSEYLTEEMGPLPEHPLLVLTHSKKGFSFVNISLAHYLDDNWLYQTPDLRQELHTVVDDLPKEERPNPQALQIMLQKALAKKKEQEEEENESAREPDTSV
jgi:hypothetical protein